MTARTRKRRTAAMHLHELRDLAAFRAGMADTSFEDVTLAEWRTWKNRRTVFNLTNLPIRRRTAAME